MIDERPRAKDVGDAAGERARHRRAGVAEPGDAAEMVALDVRQRDQIVIEGRHEVERGDPPVLEQAGGDGGIPVGQADQRPVQQRHGDHRANAHRVVERHRGQRALAEHVVALHDVGEGRAGLGAMRARHALGATGRARRVEHDADVRLRERHRRRAGVGVAGSQRGEADGVRARRGADGDPVPHARQRRTGGADGRRAGGLEDDGDGVGVLGAEAHLALGVAPVERGRDHAELLAGPVERHVLDAVLEDEDDVVALLDAEPRQPRRHPVGARLEIAVGEALLVVGDRLGAGDALGGDGERARQARGHVRLRNPPARSSRPCARPRAARGRAGGWRR